MPTMTMFSNVRIQCDRSEIIDADLAEGDSFLLPGRWGLPETGSSLSRSAHQRRDAIERSGNQPSVRDLPQIGILDDAPLTVQDLEMPIASRVANLDS